MKTWRCENCSWTGTSPDTVVVFYHRCRIGNQRSRLVDWLTEPGPEDQAEKDRTDWFTSRYPTPKEDA